MTVDDPEIRASLIAAAIGEPARARMLYGLLDGRARTSTELAIVAEVTPSTASVHLQRLKTERLVRVFAQGKHRYYSLESSDVAAALEALSVLAGGPRQRLGTSTPQDLRTARTCYDHIAGRLGVTLNDLLLAEEWLIGPLSNTAYILTERGEQALMALGLDIEGTRALRRRFAFACVDWSERRPHLGGALGAALLGLVLKKKWVLQDLDTRRLRLTQNGRREIHLRFGVDGF
jgi:DNA-binding transcriptional ArsR family regulator